jgi:diaminohydroxyphosphoribosylaminopyrimidine deaminase/5-amino-6-(5-phosphoribosylamino)uracil reductase
LEEHHPYLHRALALARSRRGYCAPNPAVGAVLVKEGVIIGEGAHYAWGEPHAEVMALRALKSVAPGATLYVSLEPCCHTGRTPPCTQAVLAAGITRVIYGYQDPNPLVAGQGHRQLAESGVETLQLSLPEIDQFYNSYRHWRLTQRPWVSAKIALSLDGKIAGPGGERISITGAALKQHTYRCRQRSDAILTTAKTVIQDNPALNVCLNHSLESTVFLGGSSKVTPNLEQESLYGSNTVQSKRLYILDGQLRLSGDYQIWKNTQPITVFYSAENSGKIPAELLERGVIFVPVLARAGLLDLEIILQHIGKDGVHDLWVEAGGILLESLMAAGSVHNLQVYCAPKWLGSTAQSAFQETALSFEHFTHKQWHPVGDEAICEMTLALKDV